jgi:hypothetical protein
VGVRYINELIYKLAQVSRRPANQPSQGNTIATPFEQINRAEKVIEDFNRNNYLMANGVPSEILILEHSQALDYYTHYYTWLENQQKK